MSLLHNDDRILWTDSEGTKLYSGGHQGRSEWDGEPLTGVEAFWFWVQVLTPSVAFWVLVALTKGWR